MDTTTVDTEISEAAIFARVLDAESGDLPAEVAQHILALNLAKRDRDRATELAAKACREPLSEQETAELESYNLIGDLLALWHSKARRSLKKLPEDYSREGSQSLQ